MRYGVVVLFCTTTACASSSIHLRSISPTPGTTVSADSTITAEIEYKVKNPASSHLFVMMLLSTREGTTRTIMGPVATTDGRIRRDPQIPLPDTAGVVTIRFPLVVEWGAEDLSLPLKVWIFLNEPTGAATSTSIQTLGPFTYKIPYGRTQWLNSHPHR